METDYSAKNGTVSGFITTSKQNITWNPSESNNNFLHFAMRHSVFSSDESKPSLLEPYSTSARQIGQIVAKKAIFI